MDRLYLIKVWKESRTWFFLLLLFLLGQLFFTVKRVQNFPFFIYDMYSRPVEQPVTFTIYEVKKGTQSVDYTALTNLKESILLNSIHTFENNRAAFPDYVHRDVLDHRLKKRLGNRTYEFIRTGLSNDSQSISSFPAWINTYALQTTDSFFVLKYTYRASDKKRMGTEIIISSHGR